MTVDTGEVSFPGKVCVHFNAWSRDPVHPMVACQSRGCETPLRNQPPGSAFIRSSFGEAKHGCRLPRLRDGSAAGSTIQWKKTGVLPLR